MPDPNQQEAYPSLLPGSHEFGGNWTVQVVSEEATIRGGNGGAATDKVLRILQVPKPQLPHDWDIRGHEYIHVMRPQGDLTGNVWRDMVRQMLDEVCVDSDGVNVHLHDMRYARDQYDYSKAPPQVDEYHAALEIMQLWGSAQVAKNDDLLRYYDGCRTLVENSTDGPTHLAAIDAACQAVWDDTSQRNLDTWADFIAATFVPTNVPVEMPVKLNLVIQVPQGGNSSNEPENPTAEVEKRCQCGDVESAHKDGTGACSGEADPECECGDPKSEHRGPHKDGKCKQYADCECEEYEGNEPGICPELCEEFEENIPAGTAGQNGSSASGTEDSSSGLPPGGGTESPEGTGGSGSGSSPETQNTQGGDSYSSPNPGLTADNFSFDPMTREHNLLGKEPLHPPEPYRTARLRTIMTKEALRLAMQVEEAERKQGPASHSAHLTALTPYGAVDVHRHTFNRSGTVQVASAWRPVDAGATIRYPTGLFANNGRVFGIKARGGTILVDSSGSMDWHHDIIREAMASGAMPNLCVARYSFHGTKSSRHREYTGQTYIARLCIIASMGRYSTDDIKDEPETTGANAGSDPASLYYAAKFLPQPIVWVSDGMVSFGEEDAFYRGCDAVMRQYKIPRVLTLEDAVAFLKGQAVPGWYQCYTGKPYFVRRDGTFQPDSRDPAPGYAEARRWSQLRAQHKVEYNNF